MSVTDTTSGLSLNDILANSSIKTNTNSDSLTSAASSATGKKALADPQPMQIGDVKETFADISAIERDLGFHPATSIDQGVPRFVDWYRDYHQL